MLGFDDVGLAFPIQSALEAGGHTVAWDGSWASGPPANYGDDRAVDVVLLAADGHEDRLGPAVAAWIAAFGTTEVREIRGKVPWYGTLTNHGVLVIPAAVAGVAYQWLVPYSANPLAEFATAMVAAAMHNPPISSHFMSSLIISGRRKGWQVEAA